MRFLVYDFYIDARAYVNDLLRAVSARSALLRNEMLFFY